MLAALSCNTDFSFVDLCRAINDHDPTGIAGPVVSHLVAPVIVFVLLVLAGRVLRRVLTKAPAIRRDPQVRALVHNVVTAATFVFGLLAALVAGGLPIAVLLTFGGLGSLAVGLAFQDVLRNLLAGIFLLVEQPFKLGDVISVNDHTGVVETIQLRTTALKTAEGKLAIVPNLACFSTTVINLSAFETRRFEVALRVPRDRKLGTVLANAEKILLDLKGPAATPQPSVVAQVDGEENLLHCYFWLDYRSHDPDAVRADLATQLSELGLKTA